MRDEADDREETEVQWLLLTKSIVSSVRPVAINFS